MISGLVLKYLNGSRFVIPGRYPSPLPCRKPGSSDTADQHVAAVGNPVVEIGQSRLLAIPGGGGLPRIVQGDVIVGDEDSEHVFGDNAIAEEGEPTQK